MELRAAFPTGRPLSTEASCWHVLPSPHSLRPLPPPGDSHLSGDHRPDPSHRGPCLPEPASSLAPEAVWGPAVTDTPWRGPRRTLSGSSSEHLASDPVPVTSPPLQQRSLLCCGPPPHTACCPSLRRACAYAGPLPSPESCSEPKLRCRGLGKPPLTLYRAQSHLGASTWDRGRAGELQAPGTRAG